MKVPSDPVTRASIKEAISQADAQFVGRISAEWGHKWLSLILEPPTELE